MARTPISRTSIPVTGLNLTDATFATLGTGANNGVEVPYNKNDLLVLRNDTVGAAAYTLKVATPTKFSERSSTVGDVTVTVAAGKIWLYPVGNIFRQSDGDIYVDCDVAGKVAVLIPPTD